VGGADGGEGRRAVLFEDASVRGLLSEVIAMSMDSRAMFALNVWSVTDRQ
jgi:hypothetical protein